MVRAQRAAMTDPAAPTPSVEAILHAIIPFKFVDHTHADAVVAMSNSEGGERRIREVYSDRVLVIPYVMPGFVLARAVYERARGLDWKTLEGMVLLNHGIFTWGNDAKTSYERMITLVTKAEDYLKKQNAWSEVSTKGGDTPLPTVDTVALARLRREASLIRGRPMVASLDSSPGPRGFAARPDLGRVATRGPLTPDHVIRTKPIPAILGEDASRWPCRAMRLKYREYFTRHQKGETCLDAAPRWVLWPGRGSIALGATAKDAGIVGDIARHTMRAIGWAESLGGWQALPEKDLFEVEYWELEQAKLKGGGAPPPLQGKVALVTGAASGIGRAAAEMLMAQGAAVAALDIKPEIAQIFTGANATGLACDVTDGEALRRAIETDDHSVRRTGYRGEQCRPLHAEPEAGRVDRRTVAAEPATQSHQPPGALPARDSLSPTRLRPDDHRRRIEERSGTRAWRRRILGGQGRADAARPGSSAGAGE